jgi:hypothetical protein
MRVEGWSIFGGSEKQSSARGAAKVLVRGHERAIGAEARTFLDQRGFSSSRETSVRVLQNRFHMLYRDAGEPLDEVTHGPTAFQVLEKRRNGNSRATKYPRSAHYFWRALDNGT